IGGTRVSISCPKRGDKVRLTDMARANASEQARIAISEDEIVSRTLLDLQAMLGLTSCPMRIESYDISNTAGSETVASMIVFRGAKPLKSAYRKFKIKTVIGQDDYAAMHEVLMRRMERYVAGDDKFKELPDVILLDGGRGQVSAVAPLLRDMGIATPVFGMVKDDRHRTRAIVREDGAEVGISANPGVFKLVGTIQEEVHRFAIGYHRKLRAAHAHTSVLEKISGIGDARRSALLRQFKSLANIRAASIEELARVVPMSAAVRVYNYFNDTEER
ncbi:MAG: excinuclease ABC subunit UvrC, partial [Clostridia bacterium]